MKSSMADYLKVVAPHLGADLVSSVAMSRLEKLTQKLPPCSKSVLELRLAAGISQVDCCICPQATNFKIPKNFLTHSTWEAIDNLCQQEGKNSTFTNFTNSPHPQTKYIWLEFDLDQEPDDIPIPCVFVDSSWGSENKLPAPIDASLKLPNYLISDQQQANLKLCIDALPNLAKIEHLGAMFSRSSASLRITILGISLEQLPDYLNQIGWKDPSDIFLNLLDKLSTFLHQVDFLVLNIDLGDQISSGINPCIAIEFYPKKQPHINSDSNYEEIAFFNYLVETGLCTPEKKNALLAWPGVSQKADCPELWPKNLVISDLLLGNQGISVFQRTINHIKIVFHPFLPLEAKAYLGIIHNWYRV